MTKFGITVMLILYLATNAVSFAVGGVSGFFYCKYLIMKALTQLQVEIEQQSGRQLPSDGEAFDQYRNPGDFNGTSF